MPNKKDIYTLQEEAMDGNKNAFKVILERANATPVNLKTGDYQYIISYLYGVGICVDKDCSLQLKWAQKASDNGNYMGTFLISENYRAGEAGLDLNEEKALKYCEKSYSQIKCHKDINVQFRLGTYYLSGKGGNVKRKKGFTMIVSASYNGFKPATDFLKTINFENIVYMLDSANIEKAFNDADYINR